jgi:hypothetical protein
MIRGNATKWEVIGARLQLEPWKEQKLDANGSSLHSNHPSSSSEIQFQQAAAQFLVHYMP